MATTERNERRSPVTMYGFVGNPGCIRFPQPIRKAAGIKRGDRLLVMPRQDGTVVLEKLAVPPDVPSSAIEVDACACALPPEACGKGDRDLVTVGWSYVQLNRELAAEMGFDADAPLKLQAEPGQISVSLHDDPADLEAVPLLRCPP